MTKCKNRVGEKKIANNGLEMEIIAYRGITDIDIQFSDGTIVEHKTYQAFCNGHIRPNKEDIEYQKLLSFMKGKVEVWSELQEKVSLGAFSEVPEELNQYILRECTKSKIELEELIKKSK